MCDCSCRCYTCTSSIIVRISTRMKLWKHSATIQQCVSVRCRRNVGVEVALELCARHRQSPPFWCIASDGKRRLVRVVTGDLQEERVRPHCCLSVICKFEYYMCSACGDTLHTFCVPCRHCWLAASVDDGRAHAITHHPFVYAHKPPVAKPPIEPIVSRMYTRIGSCAGFCRSSNHSHAQAAYRIGSSESGPIQRH